MAERLAIDKLSGQPFHQYRVVASPNVDYARRLQEGQT
jgi:hypothetical protein